MLNPAPSVIQNAVGRSTCRKSAGAPLPSVSALTQDIEQGSYCRLYSCLSVIELSAQVLSRMIHLPAIKDKGHTPLHEAAADGFAHLLERC